MNCEDLEQLIVDGKSDYVIHLECSTTVYREVIHSVSKYRAFNSNREWSNEKLNSISSSPNAPEEVLTIVFDIVHFERLKKCG